MTFLFSLWIPTIQLSNNYIIHTISMYNTDKSHNYHCLTNPVTVKHTVWQQDALWQFLPHQHHFLLLINELRLCDWFSVGRVWYIKEIATDNLSAWRSLKPITILRASIGFNSLSRRTHWDTFIGYHLHYVMTKNIQATQKRRIVHLRRSRK